MSTLSEFNFKRLLETGDAWDVEFRITPVGKEEGRVVRAHRFLLSLLSPVMKKQLEQLEEDHVEISGPSYTSFNTLISFLYTGEKELVTGVEELSTLFEIYCLVDMYQVRGMQNLVREAVSTFHVNNNTLVDALTTFNKYRSMFLVEDLVSVLEEKCVSGMKSYLHLDVVSWDDGQVHIEDLDHQEKIMLITIGKLIKHDISSWGIEEDVKIAGLYVAIDQAKLEMEEARLYAAAEQKRLNRAEKLEERLRFCSAAEKKAIYASDEQVRLKIEEQQRRKNAAAAEEQAMLKLVEDKLYAAAVQKKAEFYAKAGLEKLLNAAEGQAVLKIEEKRLYAAVEQIRLNLEVKHLLAAAEQKRKDFYAAEIQTRLCVGDDRKMFCAALKQADVKHEEEQLFAAAEQKKAELNALVEKTGLYAGIEETWLEIEEIRLENCVAIDQGKLEMNGTRLYSAVEQKRLNKAEKLEEKTRLCAAAEQKRLNKAEKLEEKTRLCAAAEKKALYASEEQARLKIEEQQSRKKAYAAEEQARLKLEEEQLFAAAEQKKAVKLAELKLEVEQLFAAAEQKKAELNAAVEKTGLYAGVEMPGLYAEVEETRLEHEEIRLENYFKN